MWYPSRVQWGVIWTVAVLLILAWPPLEGRSLGLKLTNWLADPSRALPSMPPPLPMGLGDDADAVIARDLEEAEYYRVRDSSATARLRLRLKDAEEPFDPKTERQVLIGVGVLAVLGIWRLAPKGRQVS